MPLGTHSARTRAKKSAMPYQRTLPTQAVVAEIASVWNDCELLPIVFQGQNALHLKKLKCFRLSKKPTVTEAPPFKLELESHLNTLGACAFVAGWSVPSLQCNANQQEHAADDLRR